MQIDLISRWKLFPNNRSFGMDMTRSLLVHHAYYTNVTKTLLFACWSKWLLTAV